MILPWGEALGEGRSLDDVLSNRAIPLWGRGERCADNVLRVECQSTRTERNRMNSVFLYSLITGIYTSWGERKLSPQVNSSPR